MEAANLEEALERALKLIVDEIHQLAENVLCVALELQRGNKVVTNRIAGDSFERMKADRDEIQERLNKANAYFKTMKARHPEINWTKEG